MNLESLIIYPPFTVFSMPLIQNLVLYIKSVYKKGEGNHPLTKSQTKQLELCSAYLMM